MHIYAEKVFTTACGLTSNIILYYTVASCIAIPGIYTYVATCCKLAGWLPHTALCAPVYPSTIGVV